MDKQSNKCVLTYLEALKILTPVEINVLDLIEQGLINKEIAEKLGISKGTVRKHRDNIRRKLGITGPNGTQKWLWQVRNSENKD